MFGYQFGGQRLLYWYIVYNLSRKGCMLQEQCFRCRHCPVPRKRVRPTQFQRLAKQNPDRINTLCLLGRSRPSKSSAQSRVENQNSPSTLSHCIYVHIVEKRRQLVNAEKSYIF